MKTQCKSANPAPRVKARKPLSPDGTAENIDRFGWKLCGVLGDGDHFPFIHTLGNHGCGLPELLTIGCDNGDVVNSVCELMRKRNRPFRDGELIELRYYEYPLKALDANDEAKIYAWRVEAYYGTDDYTVQQLLIPDSSGRYPGDPECAVPWCLVPILKGKYKLRRGALPDFARININ
jgi:hypothetical protein